jgi:acetyl esterase/lipase
MNIRKTVLLAALAALTGQATAQTNTVRTNPVGADGVVDLPAFSVPLSRYMSEQARQKFTETATRPRPAKPVAKPTIAQMRENADAYYRPIVERERLTWPVRIDSEKIGGVATQIITPDAGIPRRNSKRVLINLHGGSFLTGAGLGGLTESIPIAGTMGIKVVTVDYRMAPEYQFPSASEDVASVYLELLKHHKPADIGIFGCSAGGILSAMSIAWFLSRKLPVPGALGIFHAGAFASFSGSPADTNSWGGDSRYLAPPLLGQAPLPVGILPPNALRGAMDYTANADPNDPLASPALSPSILRAFPPTLLITGTRAF